MRDFYSNINPSCLAKVRPEDFWGFKILLVIVFVFSSPAFSQSNHTVSFTNAATDFNALEKISAAAGATDYYITFDQNNLYIGAFRISGFAASDNLAIYIDTDPQAMPISGNGSATGKLYNGVTPALPFNADYNVYAEEAVQQANNFSGGSWITVVAPSYSTSANSREIKIPFASMGNPYALNITMWMGNAGSIYSNVPGANIASSASPSIVNYFGTFGIKNGAQGNVNPVNVITAPATGYLAGATSIAGGAYAYIDITANATINGLTLAPGGVINVEAGKTLTSTGIINNTAIPNNTKSTQINVSGIYTLRAFAYCSSFNVNNGGTYTHNAAGSAPNGVPADWPGIDTRTYGVGSNVNILQWATSSANAVTGIPPPTSGGWGNVMIGVSQNYKCNWFLNGAFNNIGGNLILKNIGTASTSYYLTFNNDFGTTTQMNIGGNFEMRTSTANGIYFNFALFTGAIFTLNIKGDFIVTGGHIKFGHKRGKVIVNYWGSYNQTGGEVRAETTDGVTINAYGVNKFISATYTLFSGTDFNTSDMTYIIKNGANIFLNSDMPLGGTVLDGSSYCKFIVEGTLNCNNYQITNPGGGITFTLDPGGTLDITDKNGITSSGNSGSIQTQYRNFSIAANYLYNGTSNQITGSGLPATVNSLTINNSSNSNTVSLTNSVTITSFHEIDKGIFSLGNNNVTLHSDVNATASFNKLGTGAGINYSGTGRYIVERYINSGTGAGQHGKAWMLLSTPATDVGLSVYNSWQENRSSIVGYGTWITDPSGTPNGFDAVSISPSMKSYDPASEGWIGIPSTNIAIENPKGYFIYIRGDRSVTASVPAPTPTTLRIKGKLLTGNQPSNIVSPNSFQSVGNPYASAVDFKKLYGNSSNIDNTFYVWDPSVGGDYGAGGYQTVSGTTGYIAVPGGSGIYTTNTDYSNIQSGEAIMVHNSGASSGSVNFTEDCKTTGSILVARQSAPSSQNAILFANLYAASGALTDGNAVSFNNSYSNKIDENDALKITNTGENFGIKRGGQTFAIEARSTIKDADTIFYDLRNLKKQNYTFSFFPEKMNTTSNAFLIDHFLKTEKAISLSDSTLVSFSVTTDPASSDSDRFILVFRTFSRALSVAIGSIDAYEQGGNILIEWRAKNENGLKTYDVERSTDGIHFSMFGTVPALNLSNATYRFVDYNPVAGIHYYRVRSVDLDGQATYSAVTKIIKKEIESSINVYPNPLVDGKINIQFVGQVSGTYRIRLVNTAGQILLSKEISHSANNPIEDIELKKNLAHGIYHLEVIKPNGDCQVIKLTR